MSLTSCFFVQILADIETILAVTISLSSKKRSRIANESSCALTHEEACPNLTVAMTLYCWRNCRATEAFPPKNDLYFSRASVTEVMKADALSSAMAFVQLTFAATAALQDTTLLDATPFAQLTFATTTVLQSPTFPLINETVACVRSTGFEARFNAVSTIWSASWTEGLAYGTKRVTKLCTSGTFLQAVSRYGTALS